MGLEFTYSNKRGKQIPTGITTAHGIGDEGYDGVQTCAKGLVNSEESAINSTQGEQGGLHMEVAAELDQRERERARQQVEDHEVGRVRKCREAPERDSLGGSAEARLC